MSEKLCRPNLPQGRVKKLLIGEKYAEIGGQLNKLDIEVIFLPDISEVDERLSGHVDLAVLPINGNIFLGGRAGEAIAPILRSMGFKTPLTPLAGEKYPLDATLNACVMGEHVIHNKDFSILSENQGFIHVKQGYTKCSCCVVGENALITSDCGIAKQCTDAGLDVLQISPLGVRLPGFDTGFFGGASFKLSKKIMAFTGDIYDHPDAERIIDFLQRYHVRPLCLTDGPLLDIGSAVLLTEE